MKIYSILFVILTFTASFSFGADEFEEGTYESGTCSTANVKKGMNLGDKFWESVPFIGKKNQTGCCVATVVQACNEPMEDMDVDSHTEVWANCMKSYAFSKNTTQCRNETCKSWAADCIDVGVGSIRKLIKERKNE